MVLTALLENLSSGGSAKQIRSAIFTSLGSVSVGRPGEKSHSVPSPGICQGRSVVLTALLESLSSVGSANHVYYIYQSSAFV